MLCVIHIDDTQKPPFKAEKWTKTQSIETFERNRE